MKNAIKKNTGNVKRLSGNDKTNRDKNENKNGTDTNGNKTSRKPDPDGTELYTRSENTKE